MNVLVIGKGGREHAIADAIYKSKKLDKLYVAPGNDGMSNIATLVNIKEMDNEKLVEFALANKIDLTVVGPDACLGNGIVDDFEKAGLRIFGPTKKAALIEGSKEFAKDLMKKYNIPTAQYEAFDDYEKALEYINKVGAPIVIKYDGLAAGKGVVVAKTKDEAICAIKEMLLEKKFGDARVVIEEYLEGIEFSLMAFVSNEHVYPMVIAKDHKRAYDNDLGPNTGGMGAFSPVPQITDEDIDYSVKNIMEVTAKAMVKENRPFKGVLYGGLMKTNNGVKVIEFNARFGDPETEVVLPRLESDIIDVFMNTITDSPIELSWDDMFTFGVVLASKGYPGSYPKGLPIKGIEKCSKVYHMGTKKIEDGFVTDGGRVLFVIGKGKTKEEAYKDAYDNVEKIESDALFYRKDIGLTR